MKELASHHTFSYPNFPKWEIGIFTFLTLGLLLASWFQNEAHFIYPLDDSYIHLSLARQIVEYGNWGLSEQQFSFSSSGPLYTLLIAGFMKLLGNHEIIPLIINYLTGLATIFLFNTIITKTTIPANHRTIINVAFIILTPLPLLALNGMEHALQVCIALAMVYPLSLRLFNRSISWPYLLGVAFFTVFIRYEGIFIIGLGSLLLCIRKDFWMGICTLISGLFPISLLGLFSLNQGGTFFPISVLSKGHSPDFSFFGMIRWVESGIIKLWENAFMLALIGTLGILLWGLYRKKTFQIPFYFILITLLITVAHSFTAEIGGYRYEAYLVGLGFLGIVLGAHEMNWTEWNFPVRFTPKLFFQMAFGMMMLSLIVRSGYFHYYYPRATQNIYHQQYQMAEFLSTNFPQASIAANDIGAVTYFTEIALTDLVGIGDQAIYQMRKNQTWNAHNIDSLTLARKVSLAMVHDIWVESIIPPSWQKIGEWIIPDNFICADEKVSFYIVDHERFSEIKQALRKFSGQLPEQIIWEIYD